jgi:antitoxin component YwqK of YwqJK toxin-antitoxin module
MRHVILLSLLIVSVEAFSQPNENMFFNKADDKVIFFLDKGGDITIKSKASYYRISRIDTAGFSFLDSINDYYITGQKAYQAIVRNGYLYGNVKSFYENGNLKYEGYYKRSERDSIWKYYFDNGAVEKVIQYKDGLPYVQKLYRKNGREVISNGNGKYKSYMPVLHKSAVE